MKIYKVKIKYLGKEIKAEITAPNWRTAYNCIFGKIEIIPTDYEDLEENSKE
jgi:hypothetical protein